MTTPTPGSDPRPLPLPGSDEATALAPLCSVFRRYLKSLNLKYTPERAAILDGIIEHDAVFEVDELLTGMRERGYRGSKATAYRTIKLLQEAGIIIPALFDAKQAHYRLIYGNVPRESMVCVKTGETVEFADERLDVLTAEICKRLGWKPVGHRFQIYAISPGGHGQKSSPASGD